MDKCPHCKAKLLTDHAFCPKCGFDMRPGKTSTVANIVQSTSVQEQAELYTNVEQLQEPLVERQTAPYKRQRMFSNPFSFDGRIRRMEYALSVVPAVTVITIITSMLDSMRPAPSAIAFLYIPLYWFFWAQGAKRCHDLGNSGWFQIIPFYGLWMIFADGEPGINEYGRNPKEY